MPKNYKSITQRTLTVDQKQYTYYSLAEAEKAGLHGIGQLPHSLKILLENLLRHQDDKTVTAEDIEAMADWLKSKHSQHEIAFYPARVLMQDFTGVPAIVDLAALRDAMVKLGGNPNRINPSCPVDLVIDHSVQVDFFGNNTAFEKNVAMEFERNRERYEFLRWGQQAFENFRVVPPGTGICHQVNLEYLAKCVYSTQNADGSLVAYPDTLVGTDSHTTMVNGLGVLGWGVGGIEAEASMLGQAFSMIIPEVIGFRLEGKLPEGVTATDLVLTVTQMLRKKGVVGKFVEFFGPGIAHLSLADRATVANMAPEYGATCGLFPIDEETLQYLQLTGRDAHTIALVKAYAQAQGLWHDANSPDPVFTDTLILDLHSVEPCLAGPKRPQDRVPLSQLPSACQLAIEQANKIQEKEKKFTTDSGLNLQHGSVVIAAITSCTNTSNPSVMLAAGLVAKKAVERGLKVKPWVKTSLAPGSKVVTDYLEKAGLLDYLQQIGFYLVGYGCTTCIGNSGPLEEDIAKTITEHDLVVSAVLSGNRNFEGRVHPQVKANWLASPPLVVLFALTGNTCVDLLHHPIANDAQGHPVYLKDLWPTTAEIQATLQSVNQQQFNKEYAEVFAGDANWRALSAANTPTYPWDPQSTYINNPPFFTELTKQLPQIKDVVGARILALLGDSITTDHISPAGNIKSDSPAGRYLQSRGVDKQHFNSYGARRGHDEVMVRGTFANIRIRNEMVPGIEGGFSKHFPDEKVAPIFDVATQYAKEQVPLIIIAGKEYGTGSSRDWAAKGTLLLGVKAVIAESFERIHRSNLIGMGILPLEFKNDMTRKTLQLTGDEIISIAKMQDLKPGCDVRILIQRNQDNTQSHENSETTLRSATKKNAGETIELRCRIDTQNELNYFNNGGILQYVLRGLLE